MVTRLKQHFWTLLAGDLVAFYLALFLAIYFRTFTIPDFWYVERHFVSFSSIFVLWILVMYVAGLYDVRSLFFREFLARILISAQLFNSALAVMVFYLVSSFGITPKLTLFFDLVITFALLLAWRMWYVRKVASGVKERVLMVGEGDLLKDLKAILSHMPQLGLLPVDSMPANVVILDTREAIAREQSKELYPLMLEGARFLDAQAVYEAVTGRIAPGVLSDMWALRNISLVPKPVYTALKRLMDILITIPLLVIPVIVYPFVWLAIRIEDGGSVFIAQERVGKGGKLFKIHKFRSMTGNDSGNYQKGVSSLRVTKVGAFLRKSRLDEFPQLLTVIMGDQSLVGPRPELPALVGEYQREIPYYDLRHTIKPGVSGWAQIYHENHPHHGTAVEQTRDKLSYDLYYVKNRSFILDLKIALKTIMTLLSRVGV